MFSVLRPAAANARPFGSRFLVEENLQTKKRRRAMAQQAAAPLTASSPTSRSSSSSSAQIVGFKTSDKPTTTTTSVAVGPSVEQHPFQEYTKNVIDFFRLLETNLIGDFLRCDKCYKVSDNYALSMVFIYFIRAEFSPKEYTKENFFFALYLALDMEDDVDEFKFELFPWCLGKDWKRTYPRFLQERDRLWKRMGYRALCSKAICDEIMRIVPSPHWNRVRKENHGGAVRKHRQPTHPNNDLPVGPFGTPVPCFHCILAEEEERDEEECWSLCLEKSSPSPSRSKSGDESDFFVTAEESWSNDSGDIDRLFGPAKREEDSSFLDLSSSGYREGSAFGGDGGDGQDFWGANAASSAAPLEGRDIFASSSEEEGGGGDGARDGNAMRTKDVADDGQNGYLTDIFWNSSDETNDAAEDPKNEPTRAHRSFSRINLRDADAPSKRSSPRHDVFLTED